MAGRGPLPLGMFPLGAVLFPHMELPLHVFEPRYQQLTLDCLRAGRRFGVVLIERGHEVGGGDERFGIGTVARITAEAQRSGGRWALLARGEERLRVTRWLPDDPYPVALVEPLEEQDDEGGDADDEGGLEALGRAVPLVRRALALAAELDIGHTAPATLELDADPAVASWQLCAALPVGPVDQQALLEVAGASARNRMLARMAGEACELFALRLSGR